MWRDCYFIHHIICALLFCVVKLICFILPICTYVKWYWWKISWPKSERNSSKYKIWVWWVIEGHGLVRIIHCSYYLVIWSVILYPCGYERQIAVSYQTNIGMPWRVETWDQGTCLWSGWLMFYYTCETN